MIIYIAYFIFFVILAVEYELKPFRNHVFLIIAAFLLVILAGFRGPEVAKDYEGYQLIFDSIYEMRGIKDVFIPLLEPGFTAIVLLFRWLFQDNYGLAIMLFIAIVSVVLKTISFKYLTFNPYLAILFYYSHYFLLHEMTQIRIGLASAIFFIALIFYLKGNIKVFILMILGATFFHYSAILYLIILLFDPKKFNKYLYSSILVVSLILGYLKIPFLNFLGNFDPSTVSQRLGNYAWMVESGNAESVNVFNILNLINMACSFYYIIFIPNQKLIDDKSTTFFLKCNIVSILLLSLLAGIPSFAYRFSELFGIMSICLFASLVKYLPFSKWNILITVLFAFIVFYTIVFHIHFMNPYYMIKIK